jgi:hypothetical protein
MLWRSNSQECCLGLADVIGGSGQKAFIDKGSSALTLLLGGPIVSSIRAKIDTLATT